MHKVTYSRKAVRSLCRIPQDRSAQIVGSINELATYENLTLHPKVKQMKGNYTGFYRIRAGDYRAIFALNPDLEAEPYKKLLLINVSAVGTRQGIY